VLRAVAAAPRPADGLEQAVVESLSRDGLVVVEDDLVRLPS
jgi:hypothetical protein